MTWPINTFEAKRDWDKGPRVRVETLRKGDRFTCISGGSYAFERKDGALSGAYHVRDAWTSKDTCFAGSAEVVARGRPGAVGEP